MCQFPTDLLVNARDGLNPTVTKNEAQTVIGKLFGPLTSLQLSLESTYAPIMPMSAAMRLPAWKTYRLNPL